MLEEILTKTNEKGWNMYKITDNETLDIAIPRGPVKKLKKGKQYLLYPAIPEADNIEAIKAVSMRMQIENTYPLIHQGNISIAMPMIVLKKKKVIIRGQFDFDMDYRTFCRNLDNLQKVDYSSGYD